MDSFQNLKDQLIQAISESSDQNLILHLWQMMQSETKTSLLSEPQSIYEAGKPMTEQEVEEYFREEEIILPEYVMKMIEMGMDDVKNGRVYTEEEMEKLDKQWLQ